MTFRPSRDCPPFAVATLLACTGLLGGCAAARIRVEPAAAPLGVEALWVAPADMATRNLFDGPGTAADRAGRGPYTIQRHDTTGASRGYDVTDPQGRQWSVKLGVEAQPEIVSSRVLWAMGYHQDPMSYVTDWQLAGVRMRPEPARFRIERDLRETVGEWAWRQNPFIGTQPFAGLLVLNVLLNNWDWKTNNNKIYAVTDASGRVTRRYVVRDLGASLGRTDYPLLLQGLRLRGFAQGTKNDIEGFERQGFITAVTETGVRFDYTGIHRDLLDTIRPADVRWTCERLARLTPAQWRDAFRAAGYAPDVAARYITKITWKIAQGLELTRHVPSRPPGADRVSSAP